ncbi:Flp pilus assembly pilin Flp [Lipingzhangella halophila]|uniref:Flp pilus assembly pilin Flp n=1 Tax=Lipingzhangella halophila TaxID=1783352 RepID=A0A7W7RDT4_9ACTN|nr:hypothetical protein [Lipingzhangella halophila]MBB4930141.1 Flp pilus assembly pilin Flp [Lipingzhangella halophila]
MFTPLASLREKVAGAIAKRRSLSTRAKDLGASFVEYGALILLIAAIAGLVITQTGGIPKAVKNIIEDAITEVSNAGDEEAPEPSASPTA